MAASTLATATTLAAARHYITTATEPLAEEHIGDGGACQPQFYIIGAMKSATTALAQWLHSRAGVSVHPHEHHFWEHYPAFEWSRGQRHAVSSTPLLYQRQQEAAAALEPAIARDSGYAPGDPAMQPCVRLIHDLAPPVDLPRAALARMCERARGTLVASLSVHHGWLPRGAAPGNASAAAVRTACVARSPAVGIKAPSHLTEFFVPLRVAACVAPTVRFIVSLRDPVARAFSGWLC